MPDDNMQTFYMYTCPLCSSAYHSKEESDECAKTHSCICPTCSKEYHTLDDCIACPCTNNGHSSDSRRPIVWNKVATHQLILLFKNNYEDFIGKKKRKQQFYVEFAKKLGAFQPGVTAFQVEKKWCAILKQIKKYENSAEGSRVKCPDEYGLLCSFIHKKPAKALHTAEFGILDPDMTLKVGDISVGPLSPKSDTRDSYENQDSSSRPSRKKAKYAYACPNCNEGYINITDCLDCPCADSTEPRISMVWSDEATQLLIMFFKQNYEGFMGRKRTKQQYYADFAKNLQNVQPGVTATNVEKKWNAINKQLKKYEDNLVTGKARIKCPDYYDLLCSFIHTISPNRSHITSDFDEEITGISSCSSPILHQNKLLNDFNNFKPRNILKLENSVNLDSSNIYNLSRNSNDASDHKIGNDEANRNFQELNENLRLLITKLDDRKRTNDLLEESIRVEKMKVVELTALRKLRQKELDLKYGLHQK